MIKIKKRRRIILALVFILICFLLLVHLDTNKLMHQIKEAFLSKDYYVAEKMYYYNPKRYSNTNVNYVLYDYNDILEEKYYDINWFFNRCSSQNDVDKFSIDLELKRVFTIHNFFDGYIWISYKAEYLDENGSHTSLTATSYPLKMKIHKVKGEWKVESIGLTV